jgi:uncharacterized membrane protein YjjB (DUF3815 family)
VVIATAEAEFLLIRLGLLTAAIVVSALGIAASHLNRTALKRTVVAARHRACPGGHSWFRTSDPSLVRRVLYH